MKSASDFLTLTIDTIEPIELDAFVGAFTSLAEEFRREVRAKQPNSDADAKILVKEVRKGSYEADLIAVASSALPIISHMDNALVLEQFVQTWGRRIVAFAKGDFSDGEPTKNDLKIIANATQAIATDPNAKSTLKAVHYENGERQIKASFEFDTSTAISAQETIDAKYRELETTETADYKRVLMVFTRSDTGSASVGKRSGERVVIEEISSRPRSIMYASDLAEQRIKHEIRESEDNVYKKAFVVDVNVRLVNGKPSVYAVTHVHDVIELTDDQ